MWVGFGSGVNNEPGFDNAGCGFGIESGDAGLISFFTRNGYNTNTKVSTGLTAVSGSGYDFYIFCEPNTSKIEWMIRDVNAGTEVSGTATTNLWTSTTIMAFSACGGNAALTAAAAIDFSCAGLYAETL
jgi:hypothetical protein